MTTTSRRSGERFEGRTQVAIMLVIGTTAGAASFTHVHDVALAHGQPNWIGWADAVVVELMSIALGLELRRRARTHMPTGFVLSALVFFVAVSLSAQVVEAETSTVGWLAAALPAIGFLVLAKVVLSRTIANATSTTASKTPMRVTTALDAERESTSDTSTTTSPTPATESAPAGLLAGARIVANAHRQAAGTPITADLLADRMRVSTTTAEQLLDALAELTDTPSTTGRRNGAPVAAGVP
jgi:uncharacterized protein DUF2637